MTIWISRELPLFNFERLDILCPLIGHPCENLWPLEFLESFGCSISSISISYASESDMRMKSYDDLNFSRAFVVQFLASWNNRSPNWTSEWKVMTIWISRELPLFNFDCLDMVCAWIENPSEKLWPLRFHESFRYQFRASLYGMRLNQKCEWKVMTILISRELPLFNF